MFFHNYTFLYCFVVKSKIKSAKCLPPVEIYTLSFYTTSNLQGMSDAVTLKPIFNLTEIANVRISSWQFTHRQTLKLTLINTAIMLL